MIFINKLSKHAPSLQTKKTLQQLYFLSKATAYSVIQDGKMNICFIDIYMLS